MIVTARSRGFSDYGDPHDYWRYEKEDMEAIFADFHIQAVEIEKGTQGIFLNAKKPRHFREKDLFHHRLYSIVVGRRTGSLGDAEYRGTRRYESVLRKRIQNLIQ